MAVVSIMRFVFLLCLIGIAAEHATGTTKPRINKSSASDTNTTQSGYSAVIVNGRPLTGPNSSAQTRSGRILIPVASLARALGDSLSVDTIGRIVSVRRQDTSNILFSAALGQVLENGVVILSISNAAEITFTGNVEEMMLPVEIVSALFNASVRNDLRQNAVIITRGITGGNVTVSGDTRKLVEIYQAEYEYNLSRYSSSYSQNLSLSASGRLADGRFRFLSNSSGASFGTFAPRNFTFDLERPNGQRFVAGDFGSGTVLPLMTANVRGGLASIPIGRFTIGAFGGRLNSGAVLPIDPLVDDHVISYRDPLRYDTSAYGGYASANSVSSQKNLSLSVGAMSYSGPMRNGQIASSSIYYSSSSLQIQGDFAVGKFTGLLHDDRRSDGVGSAVDLSTTFQVAENLSVQGRYAYVGSRFLSPQFGVREPIDLKAAGVTWSPRKWLTTSINASTAKRPNDLSRPESFVNLSFGLAPGGGKPRFYFSHTQSSSRLYRSGSFTLINASKDFQRWRFFMNATRIKNIGPANVNGQLGASISLNDANSIEASQGFGSRRSLNGHVDWRTSGLFNKRLSLTAGMGYNYSPVAKIETFEKLTASVSLPRETNLNLSYIHTNAGPALILQVRGLLFRKKEANSYLNALPGEVTNFSGVSGRVYQDIDGNGKYDPATDKPQANVKVRVDGNRYVETDANGVFAFEAITAGEHKVFLDLLSVRADLTLIDGGSRDIALSAGKTHNFDFRLVRTGRITGRVWQDTNSNGKFDEGETPLGDVRVLTASGRDTLTDADGYFTIADLAPGEHTVLIDEKTLPEKTISASRTLTVQVFPGRETDDLAFCVIAKPAEVKQFSTKQLK